jgi:hypothetical protein
MILNDLFIRKYKKNETKIERISGKSMERNMTVDIWLKIYF